MAFDLNAAGSYGTGKLGDVTDPDKSIINAYAAEIGRASCRERV